jgi:hypothetical protein
VAQRRRIEWERHLHLEQPNPRAPHRIVVGEAEASQGLAHFAVGDPRRNDANPRIAPVHRGPVEPVGRRVLDGEGVSDLVDLTLQLDGVGREELSVRHVHVGLAVVERDLGLRRVGVQVHRCAPVGHVGNDLQARPQAGAAGQGDCVAPQREYLGGVSRIEHRNVHIEQRPGGGRREGRALRIRIVAYQRHSAAARVAAGVDGVA